GVGEDDGVVVGVDDAGVRGDALGDVVQIRRGGDAGADVEELAHARLHQAAGGAVHEFAVDPGGDERGGEDGQHTGGGHPVGQEVGLAAEEVVVDTGGMG